MCNDTMNKQKILKAIFGGAGPKENERRYRANADLRFIADTAEPWTVDGLKEEVRRWLAEETP